MGQIPLCEPSLDGNAERYVRDCLASTFVSSVGPFVDRFEREFAAAVGSPHAVACASGTAAIHLALRALGVGPGDAVWCSDFTFIASANPIRYQQAVPSFIDSEERSWNLDPDQLAAALDQAAAVGRLPKALIVVHVLGQPADLGLILDACQRHQVVVIEDAAEALGAAYGPNHPHLACRGRQVGTVARIGCFSFNGNKIITTGGGGMVTTADAELARTLKHLSTQAKLPGLAFVHDQVGYNYRMPNLNAALGVAQLEELPRFLARKREIAMRYRTLAVELGWVHQPTLPHTTPSEWLPSVLIGPGRDAVLQRLTQAGIGARPLWLPVSDQPSYRGCTAWSSGVARRLAAQGLSLPCSVGLSEDQQHQVITALRGCAQLAVGTR